MKKMILEFEHHDVMEPKPWPVAINEENDVTSGLGTDDGARLIGFGMLGEQHVEVWPEHAWADPQLVVGLAASFATPSGMFEWALKVQSIKVVEVAS